MVTDINILIESLKNEKDELETKIKKLDKFLDVNCLKISSIESSLLWKQRDFMQEYLKILSQRYYLYKSMKKFFGGDKIE